MKIDYRKTCSVCGARLSANSECCPVCMLRMGFEGVVESGNSFSEQSNFKPELIAQRFEHYEVLKNEDGTPVELGRGAMGVTYKAFDVDLQFPVALKVISERYLGDESARLRFLREARVAASLRHPNVASVFHLGTRGDNYFYVMEFVEGETLEHLIKRSGRLEIKLALEIATQVASGLAAVHKKHIVHRDIKPANIMVALEEGVPAAAKIIDLGLAKAVDDSPAIAAISIPGAFVGTPEFASPEQFAGVGAEIRSDLYSLGVTLWEMLTGEVPFRGTPAEVMHQHQHVRLPFEQLKDAPQPVIALLEGLLEKDPAKRFQNPTEFLNVMPVVLSAIDARRQLIQQRLPENAWEALDFGQKTKRILERLRAFPATTSFRFVLWTSIVLLMAVGVMLMVNVFRSSRPTSDKSTGPFTDIKAPENSIAVLPFESLSDSKNDLYFADGVQDEILSTLAKMPQLKVISRTSVMTYRSRDNRDLPSIATALGVANVVEGTVRKDGNRVRVTTELIDARTDQTLWSDSYDRDFTDIFAIQSEIAQGVASKLRAQLSPEQRKDIEEKPTTNLEAYDLYLQAKELVEDATLFQTVDELKGLLDAIKLLEEATRVDPKFTLAYCLIAKANDILYFWRIDQTPERRALSDAAVNAALRLRPDLPEVHLAAAFHRYTCYRDYEGALVQISIAERTLPNSSDVLWLRASIDRLQGRWEESTRGLLKAVSLDPRNPVPLENLAINYFWLRRYQDAEQTYDRLIELEPDKSIFKVQKAYAVFGENADLTSFRAFMEKLPSGEKNEYNMASWLFENAVLARDWTSARETIRNCSDDEFVFSNTFTMVPRGCLQIWLARLQGDHTSADVESAAARDLLKRKAEAHPENPALLSALGMIDAALGRKQEAIQEGKRAKEMLPVSEDAMYGPGLVSNMAVVYALTNEPDLAFQELTISVETPGGVIYGELKFDPVWDPLRNDPRFHQLLAQLAPHE